MRLCVGEQCLYHGRDGISGLNSRHKQQVQHNRKSNTERRARRTRTKTPLCNENFACPEPSIRSNKIAIEVITDRHGFDDVNSSSNLTQMVYAPQAQLRSTNISPAA